MNLAEDFSQCVAKALVKEYDKPLPCGRTVFDLLKDEPRLLEVSRLFFRAGMLAGVQFNSTVKE